MARSFSVACEMPIGHASLHDYLVLYHFGKTYGLIVERVFSNFVVFSDFEFQTSFGSTMLHWSSSANHVKKTE